MTNVVFMKLSCLTAWGLLGLNSELLTHSSKDNDVGVLLLGGEELLDLVTNLTIWNLNIILGLTIIGHQGKETIVGDIKKLVLLAGDVWNIHVVGGWAQLFELLAGEDIDGDKMDLGVTVLTGLGGGHVDDLARTVLDADESVLSQGRALHWVGSRSSGIGRVEGVLMLGIVRHCDDFEVKMRGIERCCFFESKRSQKRC